MSDRYHNAAIDCGEAPENWRNPYGEADEEITSGAG
jgi:hypothetical protein